MHASYSSLERIDSMQRRFLHALEVSEEYAFTQHNFAPPSVRRDIGMLGLLHKRVLGPIAICRHSNSIQSSHST